ncbi:MAG: DUF29 domain-containing protein [Moraxellaceae bacterium]|nr:DUF29 domain-containing protein [Moraxellaceae bacterium]
MSTAYKTDIIAWANEQAAFIRAGRFDLLDLENIAEEIEDVGKSEQRELENRMSILLAHLLKWQLKARRGQLTIKEQRKRIIMRVKNVAEKSKLARRLGRYLCKPCKKQVWSTKFAVKGRYQALAPTTPM